MASTELREDDATRRTPSRRTTRAQRLADAAYFDPQHRPSGLARSAARGTVATLGGQWAGFVVQIVSTIILARLLTPGEYGLMGEVLAIVGFADLLKEMGLGAATIQKKVVSHAQVSTLFWLNTLAGVLLAGVIAGLAAPIAAFYGDAQAVAVTVALAPMFAVSGLAVQHMSLLNRGLEFRRLASVEFTSRTVGIVASIVLAALGAGIWALVAGQLVAAVMRTVQMWLACPWHPSRPAWAPEMRELLGFGGYQSAFLVVNYLSRNLDTVLVGRYWGTEVVGLYNRAYNLLLMPLRQVNAPLSRVAVPTLARLQDEPARYRRYYNAAITLIASVGAPGIAFAAVMADEVVRVGLGDRWAASAPLFQALALAGLAQLVSNPDGWLYQSTGQTRRQLQQALVTRGLQIAGFLVAVRFGAEELAFTYAVTNVLLLVPQLMYAAGNTAVAGTDAVQALRRPFVVCAVATGATFWTRTALLHAGSGTLVRLAACTLVFAAAYAAVIAVWKAARVQLFEVVGLVKDAMGARRGQ